MWVLSSLFMCTLWSKFRELVGLTADMSHAAEEVQETERIIPAYHDLSLIFCCFEVKMAAVKNACYGYESFEYVKKKREKEIYSLFIHYVSTHLQPTSQSHNLTNNDCGHATLNCI